MSEYFPYECPSCSTKLRAPASMAGKTVRCSRCKTHFPLPTPGGDPGDSAGLDSPGVPADSGAPIGQPEPAPVAPKPPAPKADAAPTFAPSRPDDEENTLPATILSAPGAAPFGSALDDLPVATEVKESAAAPVQTVPVAPEAGGGESTVMSPVQESKVIPPVESAVIPPVPESVVIPPIESAVIAPVAESAVIPPVESAVIPPEDDADIPIGTEIEEPTVAEPAKPAIPPTVKPKPAPTVKLPTLSKSAVATKPAGAAKPATAKPPSASKPAAAKIAGAKPAAVKVEASPEQTASRVKGLGLTALILGADAAADDATVTSDAPSASRADMELSGGGPTKYKVVREVARGGMGAVLLARDRDINRDVAMKVMLAASSAGREELQRFLEEAQATGQLEHPNIVPVHDVGINAKGELYFTMKFVRGRSLKEILDALRHATDPALEQEYTLTRLLQVFQQVCHAMAFAHSRGVIHRDLKPANIMVGAFGEVLVMDWGLAKVLGMPGGSSGGGAGKSAVRTVRSGDDSSRTLAGTVAGTPQFMPPEQAAGDIPNVDRRSDVYALGAILYTILSLRPPFQGADASTILTKVLKEPPEPLKPAKLFRSVPRELPAIALKAMSKEKDDRYGSARELAEDVQRFLEGRSVSARPDGLLRRCSKWLKRHKALTLSSVAAVVVAAGAVAGTLYQQRQAQIDFHLNQGRASLNKAGYKPEPASDGTDYATQLQRRDVQREIAASTQFLLAGARDFRRVLELSPGHEAARDGVAEAYMKLWTLAREMNDAKLMEITARELQNAVGDAVFEDKYAAQVRGDGSLLLNIADTAAEAFLFRFEQADGQYGRLVPVPYRPAEKPGTEPVPDFAAAGYPTLDAAVHQAPVRASAGDFPGSTHVLDCSPANAVGQGSARAVRVDRLPLGSYLVVVKAPGFAPMRWPLTIDRDPKTGLGAKVEHTVALLRESARIEGFTYVPRSPVLLGAPGAAGALFFTPKRVTVEPFLIQTREVSLAEYFEFLEALKAAGDDAQASSRRPKSFDSLEAAAGADAADAKFLVRFDADGKVEPLLADWKKPRDELRAVPVSGVSALDADAYAAWRSAKDGRKYRLPTDIEWEAASRGADGRTFSWGEIFRPEAAKLTQGYGSFSQAKLAELRAAKCDFDESPFGVFDTVGSVAEWTSDLFVADNKDLRSIRGNAWGLTPTGLQCAFRTTGSSPNYFHITIGFRLAADPPK